MAPKKATKIQKVDEPRKPVDHVLSALQLSTKRGLEHRVLLDDQIILVDNFLSAKECEATIKAIDQFPLEMTPPKRRGEADRVNYRFSVTSATFAERLRQLLTPHLPLFPPSRSIKRSGQVPPRHPVAFNSNIRFYKYTANQHFGPHYDDYVFDEQTGQTSEWTLLIYLTGAEEGVEGGETIFYKDEKRRVNDAIVAPLTRGTALLHRHGPDCMMHEGSKVLKGTKYVLRSDLMFNDTL